MLHVSRLGGILLILVSAALSACGSGGGTPTPSAKGSPKAASTGTPSAAGGSIRPIDGGGAVGPSTPSTPEPVPSSVTSAFPGLPLDKVQAMNYNPTDKRLVLVTYLANGDTAGGKAVCEAFLGVSLFDPNASISVVATDYSPLASCAKN